MLIDDSLLDLFFVEVQNYTHLLVEELFIKGEPDPEVIMRAAHSIRGAAKIVGLEDIAQLAGAIENYVEAKVGFDLETLGASINFLRTVGYVSSTQLHQLLPEIHRIAKIHLDIISPPNGIEKAVTTIPREPIVETSTPDLSDLSMLELFKLEVENQVNTLNEGLLKLESNLQDIDQIDTLMRSAHSIKGAARIIQVEAVVQLAHIMEDCFISAKEGKLSLTTHHLDTLFAAVDLISTIAKTLPASLDGLQTEIQTIVSQLHAIYTQTDTPSQEIAGLQRIEIKQTPEKSPEVKIDRKAEEKTDIPSAERVVRVSKENLNRLMGLAGESLVSANWLQPFADSLLKLKTTQTELSRLLERANDELRSNKAIGEYELRFLRSAILKAEQCRQLLTDRLNELELFARQSANLSDRLYREVIASHMRPFADGIQAFPRMVRDVARKLDKQVHLEIVGKSTQVDRDILDKLEAPLTHILRNAIDHGIETPAERISKGKPPVGTICLEASHRAGMLMISVTDDGRGIDIEKLKERIISKGLSTPAMVNQMTEAELIDFLFLPGFSTAQQVTEISGRGVGLDIVQSMVQEVGGTVKATSQLGKGTTFHLQLPLTLSVIRTLLVVISQETYAFPLSRIDFITIVHRHQIHTLETREYFTFNNQQIGIISAAQVLQLPTHSQLTDEIPVIVISDRFSTYGLVVDKFLGEKELVVRPLDHRLGKVPNISAAALMEDGSPTLIVDVEDLVRSIDKLLNTNSVEHITYDEKLATRKKRVLVVDDSLTVREVEKKLLENHGYEVVAGIDGADGWNILTIDANFDLVVTDIDMPRMSGIELVSRIRNHPNFKTLPVVIVSYKDREEDRLRGLEVGANFYLTKSSFHDNSLIQAVQDLIGLP